MNNELNMMLHEDEHYFYPIYVSMTSGGLYSTACYGYLAVTDRNRIIARKYNIFGSLAEELSFPLEMMTKLKIGKMFGIRSFRTKFEISKRKYDFRFSASPKVIGTDLTDQAGNLEGIVTELRKYQ